jgi:hypothetical protein
MAGRPREKELLALAGDTRNISVRLLTTLANEVPPERVARAIADLMEASNIVRTGSDTSATVPDHRTRLAAVQLYLSYNLGMPVQRTITKEDKQESDAETMTRLMASPAAREAMRQALATEA